MGQDLAKHNPTSSTALPIPAPDRQADTLLRWAQSGAYRNSAAGRLQLINVPGKAGRAMLKARWTELRDHMGKQDKQIVVASLIELFGCYRNGLKAGEDPRDVALKYLKELHGMPTWAIVRACEQIRAGAYPEFRTYPPTTMALRMIVRDYCRLPAEEMHNIAEVLQGEPAPESLSEPERERVRAMLEELGQSLRASSSARATVIRERRPLKPWSGEVSPQLRERVERWKDAG